MSILPLAVTDVKKKKNNGLSKGL